MQGRPPDLANWVRLFPNEETAHVVREDAGDGLQRYFLHSTQFEGLTDTQISAAAAAMIATMNGTVMVPGPAERVLMGRLVTIRADGSRVPVTLVIVDSGAPLEFLAMVGAHTLSPPQSFRAQRILTLAQHDKNVGIALRHFARSDDWSELYMALEGILDDVGNERALKAKCWGSGKMFRLLWMNANLHRHAHSPPPSRLISITEAMDMLRSIMQQWIEEKLMASEQ